MRNITLGILILLLLVINSSCKKDVPIKVNQIDLNIGYKVDNDAFVTNINKYINKAGNHYSITRLEYYLSEISLIKADNSLVQIKDFQYIDASTSATNIISCANIPVGTYKGISFNIGLDSMHNMENALPVTNENVNMIWPMMMGGGYHFMKLEGYFLDSTNTSFGYAMHLGTNASRIPVKLNREIIVADDSKFPLYLTMNINEWFANPNTFDFNKDGNYIMGNALLMKKISDNGADVFSF